MIPITVKTNSGRKAKMRIRIYRAETDKWEEPSLFWQIKNILRSLFKRRMLWQQY